MKQIPYGFYCSLLFEGHHNFQDLCSELVSIVVKVLFHNSVERIRFLWKRFICERQKAERQNLKSKQDKLRIMPKEA